mmetsp:Transcript_14781/g.31700  ORF Transcript_14781/g.31700 Transcript_14781/m.31700 type:complete len:112 (+) Transcript_14781:55-390(+)|eukprot:CAMPEP_0185843624 /NCGR_PEP_ID=MMETSP1354-20130828/62_1 /TAXON_ID=708628 /ORGANISM="Erythrolobus madagascarensis, Strain CCMP3276" /LENGTH=111 /DNA_ID=CAMNT_0028543145 /DNA_START=49 /DNA_END=384 /DNA_ORIENTATION=+
MMSKEMRRVWMKAEAYPVIAATVFGLTLSSYIIWKKLTGDPAVAVWHTERMGSIPEQYKNESKNENQLAKLWSQFKDQSYLIIGPRDGVNVIRDYKKLGNAHLKTQVDDDE